LIATSRPIAEKFEQLRGSGRRAVVAYLTAGFPDMPRSLELCRALQDSGVDILEVGVPFSDPLADGPVIQASSQRALEQGVTLDSTISLIAQARLSIPVVLFSYLNPVMAAGPEIFSRLSQAGVSGILITDLPVGSDPDREATFAGSELDFIRLVAPTTPSDRMRAITKHASGFVYLISRLGVTGFQGAAAGPVSSAIAKLRSVTTLPVCVGFGISRPEQAREIAALADGVVVGSALVDAAGRSVSEAASLAASIRKAVDAG
jgi:tryptophan synthase alpha chain